jgi:hypothetical protein
MRTLKKAVFGLGTIGFKKSGKAQDMTGIPCPILEITDTIKKNTETLN